MHEPSTPKNYTLSHLRQLQENWPVVQDADVDGVHQARIITRRIRAVLPYVAGVPEATHKYVRRIGRALGRVRELDVTDESLTTFERRVPRAPLAIGLLREPRSAAPRRSICRIDRMPRVSRSRNCDMAEFAAAAGLLRDRSALDDMKKAQEALGELNDLSVVAKLIALPLAASYFGRSKVGELTGAGSPHETRIARRRPAARSSRPAFRPARVAD
jgi:CHAD domain-containing protein